ncbi:hypothetical protein TWF696_009592 [Orbilia brochopaga]|uniref:Uncharacterized protein n=1 Tax=Orbilia brochopaga TaxID=3140254 RepID=A0AAV9UER3_9PEZI
MAWSPDLNLARDKTHLSGRIDFHPNLANWEDVIERMVFDALMGKKLTQLRLQRCYLNQRFAKYIDTEELRVLEICASISVTDFLRGFKPEDMHLQTCNIDLCLIGGQAWNFIVDFFDRLQPGLRDVGLILQDNLVTQDLQTSHARDWRPFLLSDDFTWKQRKTLRSITYLPGFYMEHFSNWWFNVRNRARRRRTLPRFAKLTEISITAGVYLPNGTLHLLNVHLLENFPGLRKLLFRVYIATRGVFKRYELLAKVANGELRRSLRSKPWRALENCRELAEIAAIASERGKYVRTRSTSQPSLEWIFFGAHQGRLIGYRVTWTRSLQSDDNAPGGGRYTPVVRLVPNAEHTVKMTGGQFCLLGYET